MSKEGPNNKVEPVLTPYDRTDSNSQATTQKAHIELKIDDSEMGTGLNKSNRSLMQSSYLITRSNVEALLLKA